MGRQNDNIACHSVHQNVSGLTIYLQEKSVGNKCMEYTVLNEEKSLLKSPVFYTLTGFAALLAQCMCIGSVVGIIVCAVVSCILTYKIFYDIEKEVLLVTVPLGLQFTAFFQSGQQTTCFIPWHCIKDVYIVEAISLHRVLYNLVVLVESDNKTHLSTLQSQRLIPLFQGTKPRLSCLESIFQSIHGLLPRN